MRKLNKGSLFGVDFMLKVTLLCGLAICLSPFVLVNPQQVRAEDTAKCPGTCVSGWFYNATYLGGVECKHGPDFTKAGCRRCYVIDGMTLKHRYDSCCELFGGQKCLTPKAGAPNPPVYPGDWENIDIEGDCTKAAACECFGCKANVGCEGVFRTWMAHCGQSETEVAGTCKKKEVAGTTANDTIKEYRATLPPTGGAGCAGGGVSGVSIKYFCGGTSPRIATAKCVANNCPEDPDSPWQPQGAGQGTGKRYECDNS